MSHTTNTNTAKDTKQVSSWQYFWGSWHARNT